MLSGIETLSQSSSCCHLSFYYTFSAGLQANRFNRIFLEEFGMARNNWENEDKDYLYLSSAGTSNKDEYFETIIGEVVKWFKDQDEGAYVGSCPWAYGGIWRPETMKVDQWGMVWAGDPPHESPGWYDVYDTDEVMNIIARQQMEVEEFLEELEGSGRGGWGSWGELN